MNADAAPLESLKRFRTSIVAIATAILLVGSVQCIVIALQEPLRPAVIWFVNLLIDRGHFHAVRVSDRGVMWQVVVLNLVIGVIDLCLAYWLASWNYKRRSKA